MKNPSPMSENDNPYTPERLEWTGPVNLADMDTTIKTLEYLKGFLVTELREILNGVTGVFGQTEEPIVNNDNVRLARYGSCIDEKGLHPVYEIQTENGKFYWRVSVLRDSKGIFDIRRGIPLTNVTEVFKNTLNN